MTFSIEVLPAPLGPMIARISCSRISRLIPVSARMPPKERVMSLAVRTASPMCLLVVIPGCSARLAQRHAVVVRGRHPRRLADLEVGREAPLAAVLEGHLAVDVDDVAAAIERVDEALIALADEAAADLARPRQLAVVGVELLVEDEKAGDLRARKGRLLGEIAVHLLDAVLDEGIGRIVGRKLLVARIGDTAPFGPIAERRQVDVDEGGNGVAVVAEGDGLLDEGEEFELVLDVFGGKERAVAQATHV